MKKAVFILIACLIPLLCFAEEENNFNPFPENKASIYEYSQDDIPDICFFPKDKARWNGYKVTNKDWNKLTDFQKVQFIAEGVKEIEKQENAEIDYNKDPFKLIIMLKYGIKDLKKESPDEEVAMINFLRGLLKVQAEHGNYIKWRNK